MKRCALVVGHKSTSQGALNARTGITEFEFNTRLALDIFRQLEHRASHLVKPVIVFRRTWRKLPGDVNDCAPDMVVSLHCNSYPEKAGEKEVSGTEVLYYHKSTAGKEMALLFQERLVEELELASRGILPRTSEDRGGLLLAETEAPAIICEPFFIDNDSDLDRAEECDLAGAYSDAVIRWCT